MRRTGLGLALLALLLCAACHPSTARVVVDDAHNAGTRRGGGVSQVYAVPVCRELVLDASSYEFKSAIDAMPRGPSRVRLWVNKSDAMVFQGAWPGGSKRFTISESTMSPVKANVSFLGFNKGDSFEVEIGFAAPPQLSPQPADVPKDPPVEPLWSGRFLVGETSSGAATSATAPSPSSASSSPSSPRR